MPGRIEGAHELEGLLDVGVVAVAGRADLLARHPEIAVLVDVADQVVGDLAHLGQRIGHGDLPAQILLQPRRPRQDVLEGNLLGLLVLAGVVRRVEVVLEVGVEVDLVERVALLLRRSLRRVARRRSFFRDRFRGRALRGGLGFGRFFLLLFEQRVLDHLLRQDFFELQFGHLQQLDRLLQRRRHHQSLGEPKVELLFEGHEFRSLPWL